MRRVWVFMMLVALPVASVGAGEVEPAGRKGVGGMKLTSPDFQPNGMIPRKFTCQGANVNPALLITGVPKESKSLALIVDDPDAPVGTWVHWVVFNIPPTEKIAEASIPGTEGINDFRGLHYGGPCPPSGTHRYFFKLYALDRMLDLAEGVAKKDLETAIKNHILAQAELVGLYKKT